MTEMLLQWLNEEIKLSKPITNIPSDFRNGYFFAELLHKMNHLPVLSIYKNTQNKKDILHNLDNLQKNLSQIGIQLDLKSRNRIINSDIYTAKIYLYKIKQLLSNKNINLEQLYFKNSNTLSKLYNTLYMRNDNEKYLKKINRTSINESGLDNYKYMRQYNPEKYQEIYNQIKKEYSHLNLNEIDMEFIMTDIKDTEYKMNFFKNYVNKSEIKQKKLNQLNSEKEFTIWHNSKKAMDNLKQRIINKSLNKISQNKNKFYNLMKLSGLSFLNQANNFEEKLSLFQDFKEKGKDKDKENESEEEEDEEEQKEQKEQKLLRELKISQVMLANIRNKLDENIKNKRIKERRERQKLKDDTYNLKNNYNNNNLFSQNKKSLFLNIQITNANNNKDNIVEIEKEKEKDLTKTITSLTSKHSTYSRLTRGDFFTNLIDNSFKIHKGNIKIGNRIQFFKTVINNNNEKDKELKLPEIDQKEYKKGFDSKQFFEELNKEDYSIFNKYLNKKKNKKQKNKNVIKPVMEQIFDIVDYIYDHQIKTNVDIINNELWKDVSIKFKQNQLLKEAETDEIIMKQLEEIEKKKKEEEEKQSFNNISNINLNTFSDLYTDYKNYTGFFNDIIIPHKFRNRKYSYIELYSEFYNTNNNNNNNLNKVDIKDYEPSEQEIENLSLPKYIKTENVYFNEILTKILEYKDEDINTLKTELKNDNEKIKEDKLKDYIIKSKGKYFYIPIKISFYGYPCSGKKTQANLFKEKYPNMKIYDPEEIFRNKINEYKELYETNIENSNPKIKNMKPAQLEQLMQEIEQKKEKFKPILDIIQPYLNIIKEKENKEDNNNKENINEKNDKEILSSIYMKLIIEELNKDFSETEEEIQNKLSEKKSIYNNYIEISQKISSNKKKLEDIETELKEIEEQKEKLPRKKELTTNQNSINKEQDLLNKELTSIKSNLFSGIIFLNFPKNKNEALELEKYFTGFELEYNKEENIVTKKLKEYDIINLNYEKNNLNKNYPLISFFDLFFNFNIDSNESKQRYENIKYDPTNGKIYTLEEIAKINDKKLLERLEKGIPGLNEKEFEEKIINYEKEIYDLSDFYKRMNNGIKSVFVDLEQKDEEKKLLKELNLNLENSIEEVITKYFYENIDLIINELKQKNNIEEEKEKEKEKNNISEDKIEEESQENQIDNVSSHLEDNMITQKDFSKKISENNTSIIYKEIISNLDSFYPHYKLTIESLIYLISSQRKQLILYLNKIQDDFIKYLNRSTEKNDIIPLYIEKYNNMMKINSKLTKNKKIHDELMQDILRVNNSIWVKVQMKKKDDINYLEEIKNSGQKEKYLNKFMELILKIYEVEIEKYLLKNEIIIKYYLDKVGLLANILGIFEQSKDEFLFKIDYKKYLYKNDTTNDHNSNNNNISGTRSDFLYNTLSTNETQFSLNKEKEKNKNSDFISNNLDKELKKIFKNSIKIIIRQERLNNNYIEKIKLVTNRPDIKDNKSNNKNSNSRELSQKIKKRTSNNISLSNNNMTNSIITSRSSIFKNKVRTFGNSKYILNKMDELTLEESLEYNLSQEKNSIKYRLMFLNCFIKRYIKLINECFSTVYNNMDDWIIMNLETQNNKLNEFITYLKRALNKSFDTITMEGREFDYNEKYFKNKKYILPLYKTIYPDEILNLNINFSSGDNFANNLVKLNSLNLIQQYVYNLTDLIELYQSIKEYSIQTCDYFVKYDIVKNIFVNKVLNEKDKEYSLFYENDNSINKNKKQKNNDEKIFNGVCKRMKFYSVEKIDKFIQIFSVYENKYININTLFTTLLIIGSELISSKEFYTQINEYVPEEIKQKNINNSHILLSLSDFMKINFWFESDQYLNELSDTSEQNFFLGQYNSSSSINQINNGMKNKNPLDEIFMVNRRKSSDFKKLSINFQKRKKIEKIKETIFDINKNNDGFIDIKIIGDLLDLLNNYCNKKQEIKNNKDKNNINDIDIDENDKCLRFSSDDLDDFIYNKTAHGKQHLTDINKVINNIFNKIFEN